MQDGLLAWCPGRRRPREQADLRSKPLRSQRSQKQATQISEISEASHSASVMMALVSNLCVVMRGASCCAQADRWAMSKHPTVRRGT